MFCCQPETLYLTKIQANAVHQFNQQNPKTLDDQIKQNRFNQILLPKEIGLLARQYQYPYSSMNEDLLLFKVSFSDQNQELVVEQLCEQPRWKIQKILLKNQQQTLEQGDQFSFGQNQCQIYRLPKKQQIHYCRQQSQTQQKCRFCFGSQTSQINPLLNLCNCLGSIKYVHLNCCRQWLKQGLAIFSKQNCSIYQFKNYQCNICNRRWKNRVKMNKKEYFLYDFRIQEDQIGQDFLQNDQQQQNQPQLLLLMNSFYIQRPNNFQSEQKFKSRFSILRINLTQQTQYQYVPVSMSEFLINQDGYYFQQNFDNSVLFKLKVKKDKIIIKGEDSINGTNVSLKSIKNPYFNLKDGILLRFIESILFIKGKNSIFRCLESQKIYKIKYKRFKE